MKTTMKLASMLLPALLLVITACSDDTPPQRDVIKKMDTTTKQAAKSDTTDAAAPEQGEASPASITEQKNRRKIDHFKKTMGSARTSDDRAEVLSDIAAGGTDMQRLAIEVRKWLADEDPFVREECLRTLATIDPKNCRASLEQGLKDGEEDVRRAAVLAWRKAPILDLSPLFSHLEDEVDPEVQRAIAMAVREHGQDYHVGQVARVMKDMSVSATKPMIEFLVAKKAVKHVTVLTEFLERSDPTVRTAAAKGLGEMGVKTRPILETLTRGLEDDSPRVRLASCTSLKKLTKQDFGFKVDAAEEARAKAVNAWKEWVKQSK